MESLAFYVTMTLFVLVGSSFLQSQLVALYILLAKVPPEEGVTLFLEVDKALNSEFYKQFFGGVSSPTNYLKNRLHLVLGMFFPLALILFGLIAIISGLTAKQNTMATVVGIVCLTISILYTLAVLGTLITVRQTYRKGK